MDLPVRVIEAVFLLECTETLEFKDYFPKTFSDSGALQSLPKFCFPEGLEKAQTLAITDPNNWLYHCFVITNTQGARLYGHCMRFQSNRLSGSEKKSPTMAICVLSKQCYYQTIHHLLFHLLSDASKHDWRETLNYLAHICVCPQSKTTCLEFVLHGSYRFSDRFSSTPYVSYRREAGNEEISFLFGLPSTDQGLFPALDFDLSLLFQSLSVENIIKVFEYILSESKIVLASSCVSLLSHVAQALIKLLWPFTWEHVFIPVLPHSMIDFIQAPTPFIMGVIWSPKHGQELSLDEKENILVDLDRDSVIGLPDEKDVAKIPSKIREELKERLFLYGFPKKRNLNYALSPQSLHLPENMNTAQSLSNHPKLLETRLIQYSFFMMWRGLFLGWGFSSITSLNDHIESATPPEFQAFFKIFCFTTTFDQYFLKQNSLTCKGPPLRSVRTSQTGIPESNLSQVLGLPLDSLHHLFHRPSNTIRCLALLPKLEAPELPPKGREGRLSRSKLPHPESKAEIRCADPSRVAERRASLSLLAKSDEKPVSSPRTRRASRSTPRVREESPAFTGFWPGSDPTLHPWDRLTEDLNRGNTLEHVLAEVQKLTAQQEAFDKDIRPIVPRSPDDFFCFEDWSLGTKLAEPAPRAALQDQISNLLTLAVYHCHQLSPSIERQLQLFQILGTLHTACPLHPIFSTSIWTTSFETIQLEQKQELWEQIKECPVVAHQLQLYLDLCQQREEEKKQQQIENEAKRNDEKRRVELFANAILSRGIQEEKKKVLFFSVFLLMIRHYCSPSTSHSFSPWDLQKQPVP